MEPGHLGQLGQLGRAVTGTVGAMSSFVINCPELSSFVQNCPVLLLRNGTPRKTANFEAFCRPWVYIPKSTFSRFWAISGPFTGLSAFLKAVFRSRKPDFRPCDKRDSSAAATSSCGRESRDKQRIIHPVKTTREWHGLHGRPPRGSAAVLPRGRRTMNRGQFNCLRQAWRRQSCPPGVLRASGSLP